MMPMWMPLQLVQSVKSAERHKVSEAGVLGKSMENELPFIIIVRNLKNKSNTNANFIPIKICNI